jgi:hypothetical protein
MGISRIEKLVYGVEDLELCRRFFTDVGLSSVESGSSRALFRTPSNQYIQLSLLDDPMLPQPVQPGSTLREVIWGVDSQDDLTAIGTQLADRPVMLGADGVLHSSDLTGFGIGFVVAQPEALHEVRKGTNLATNIGRLNRGVELYGRAHPLRIIHIALDIPKAGHEAAGEFYQQRLHFKPIDSVRPMGTFMQCEGDIEHHNFLLCHRPDRAGLNHIAMEVRDFDEVVEGGNYMASQGWKESRRLGRHNLGSNVFRMFHAPCGGRIEYAADMDRMDKSFQSRVWAETPQHHLWMLKSPGTVED